MFASLFSIYLLYNYPFSALTLWVGRQEWHPTLGVGELVATIRLELCTSYIARCCHHLHHPCFNKMQNGDILVPAYPGCSRKNAKDVIIITNNICHTFVYIIRLVNLNLI